MPPLLPQNNMEQIVFNGEHLAIGNWGKFSVYLAVAGALVALISYIFYNYNREERSWLYTARIAFITHGVAVISVFVTLFFIIQNHYFEYQYAWQHSSLSLPLKYMISCFWEGQEGSFLLWMFWHTVIGGILLFRTKSWEAPVMAVIAIAQFMLGTMLLGIDLFGYQVGSSPFDLLRDRTQGPIFSNPDYLSFIKDGNGLNPLLQNYWMVIHPPTLFFGFASTIVPFAYAVAAIWNRDLKGWVKPALPWALIAVMILGAGIIMGGYWAYESLTFGGYWAWDPVENASLIPWLIMIAAVHLMLIFKSTGKSLFTTLALTMFAFLLVLYATFLTRSGILGNTSVHSFTDLGMSGQLVVFLMLFFFIPVHLSFTDKKLRTAFLTFTLLVCVLALTVSFYKWIFIAYLAIILFFFFFNLYRISPHAGSEDHYSSREFWMFIGALLFVLSGLQVIGSTSMPVFNKLFGTSYAPPENVMEHYNKWQMPIAIIICIITAFAQFYKYKKTGMPAVFKEMLSCGAYALLLTSGSLFLFNINDVYYVVFMFAAWYAVAGNVSFMLKNQGKKVKNWGSSIAHIGFGILLLGVLVSSANKEVLSINESNQNFGEGFDEKSTREHILLWKNTPVYMRNYEVTYLGDSINAPNNYYKVNYKKISLPSGKVTEEFNLYPNAQIGKSGELMPNPDTRHYLDHDVFTYVSSVPDKEAAKTEPFKDPHKYLVKKGDTIRSHNSMMIIGDVFAEQASDSKELTAKVNLPIKVHTFSDTFTFIPALIFNQGNISYVPEVEEEEGIKVTFLNIFPDKNDPEQTKFEIMVEEKTPMRDYIILKAVKFPFIKLVWAGTIIMVIGFAFSVWKRFGERGA